MPTRIKTLFIAIAMLNFAACNHKQVLKEEQRQQSSQKIYKGILNVEADIILQPILKQQEEIFRFYYDSVQLNIEYKNENELITDFRTKKTGLVILSRGLNASEKEQLQQHDTLYVREQKVATDAVALIGNPSFNDGDLSIDLLKSYFESSGNSISKPTLVFPGQQMSVLNSVLKQLGYSTQLSKNIFAAKNAAQLFDYIAVNKNAIGFVPYNWVSDNDDVQVKKLLERIKILSLRTQNEGQTIHVSANQSDISEEVYPLTRNVNTITRFTYEDNLELLFVSFLTKEKGAKIFLKAGLIPAKMPEREINVNSMPVNDNK